MKKVEIILVIVGIFIPLVMYPFTSFSESVETLVLLDHYHPRLVDLQVVINEGNFKQLENGYSYYENRCVFPYKYTIVLGMMMVFLGCILIAVRSSRFDFAKHGNQNITIV
jgi:uncharacterized membrane protein